MRPSSNTEELPVHVFILWCSFPLFCLVDVCHCIQFIAWAKHIKQLMFVLLQDIVVPKNTNTFRWDLKNWCRLCFCPPDRTLLSGCTGDCPSAYTKSAGSPFQQVGTPPTKRTIHSAMACRGSLGLARLQLRTVGFDPTTF